MTAAAADDRGDAGDHRGVRVVTEAEPAVLARDDHAEEALLGEEAPHLGWQVAGFVDRVVVEQRAQRADLVLEEVRLGVGQPVRRHGEQGIEIGLAGEQAALEADRTGLERGAFGVAHRRQCAGERL